MGERMRLGVLGLGEGRSVLSAALTSDYWELVRICDLNTELGRARCAEFSLAPTLFTTEYRDLLEDESIDTIGIYTPDFLHADHIIAALEAGKHVICTKPLVEDLAEAGRLLAAAERSGKQVFVGQSIRFFEPMMRQREDYLAGRHGKLLSVEAHYHDDHRWFLKKSWTTSSGFSWLFGGLSHPVDQIRWYLPQIVEVMGYGLLSDNSRDLGLKTEDSMHFILRTAGGEIARVSGFYGGPVMNERRQDHLSCVLRGTLGVSESNYHSLYYTTHFEGSPPAEYDFTDRSKHYFRFEGLSHHAGEYQNYLDYFYRCLQDGARPLPDLQEGLGTVAVLTAMKRSLASGRPEAVPSVPTPG